MQGRGLVSLGDWRGRGSIDKKANRKGSGTHPVLAHRLVGHVLKIATESVASINVDDGDNLEERNAHKGISAGKLVEEGHPILKAERRRDEKG